MVKLSIITPIGKVFDDEVISVTAPSSEGEITVLPHHESLFTQLKEGVVLARTEEDEEYFSIGGGYLETDGKQITLLVSRAMGQRELDEEVVIAAKNKAQQMLNSAQSDEDRHEAVMQLRRSLIDLSLLQKVKRRRSPHNG